MKKDSVYIDPNELKQIQKGLEKLFPKDRQTNAVLQKAMMKSSKPTINTLKTAIKNQASDSGRLAKSIRAFPGKNLDRYKRPTVFVGPLVKVPKRIKNKIWLRSSRFKEKEIWIRIIAESSCCFFKCFFIITTRQYCQRN